MCRLLLRGEDVELVRVEDQPPVGPGADELPEILDLVGPDTVDVDHVGVALRAVADEPLRADAAELDAQHEPVADVEVAVDEQACGHAARAARGPVSGDRRARRAASCAGGSGSG